MQVTEKMLQTAMKKAIEHGLVSRSLSSVDYWYNRQALQEILQAAIASSDEISTIEESKSEARK